MLISFTVSNFLSFNEPQTLSMNAGKERNHSERIFRGNGLRLNKCMTIFGANASGKSCLIKAIRFARQLVVNDFPNHFSNSYFRLIPDNKDKPSTFSFNLLIDGKNINYTFSVILFTGTITKESLSFISSRGRIVTIFERDLSNGEFHIGNYFKSKEAVNKLNIYGDDSISDDHILFLHLINQGKVKLFSENPELRILRYIYGWFKNHLSISGPNDILTKYPYFSEENMHDIAKLLSALGIGISDVKIEEISADQIRTHVPDRVLSDVIKSLERSSFFNNTLSNARTMIRSSKSFYIIELDENREPIYKTIEFAHSNKNIYFELSEESDGTARLLDLIELLMPADSERVFVIDEIDRCLHPDLTVKIISEYLKLANTQNTQLIVTSHESRLLDVDILRRDEINFTVKTPTGATIINPLEKYHLRPDKKVYNALFNGEIEEMKDLMPRYDERILKTYLMNISQLESHHSNE